MQVADSDSLRARFPLAPTNQALDNRRRSSKPVYQYSRSELLRILQITVRQLAAWEKAELIPAVETYTFSDLAQIKKVRDLCERKVRPAMIRESLNAMQKQAAGMENPLLEAGSFTTGKRVVFRHGGKVVEPIAGQFMLDFRPSDTVISSAVQRPRRAGPETETKDVGELFARGIALEENPAMQTHAIAIYQKVLDLDSQHAAAHINLGTLYYNRQDHALAERHYRAAIKIDPRYALAYFDLGNVLDETGRVAEAVSAYKTALQLAPTYADAHYNLALAYEKVREPRKALKHWRAYVKLDSVGPWAVHARNQIKRILQGESLTLVPTRA